MKLAVFGATGRTGRHVVTQALERGHEVTALVRDPTSLSPQEGLTVVAGDARDLRWARKVVAGSDAVLSALGQRSFTKKITICTDAMRVILPVMEDEGVRRLVVVSGYGIGENTRLDLYTVIARLMISSILQDKKRMEDLIRASDTDWTTVKPAIITDGPHTGAYRVGPTLRLTPFSRISGADIAEFMLDQLTDTTLLRETVAITAQGG
jgi:putative NADH-flavin reductase